MEKKKKKGFTLIELLAIIVILAIIAVITVPIILNIIDNSRKGAATDSAYGFKDAVNKWYVEKISTDHDFMLKSQYTVQDGKIIDSSNSNDQGTLIPVSGEKPSSGYLNYSNNVLTGGCLVIGDYAVKFGTDGNVSSTEKGTCSSNEQGGNPTISIQTIVELYESDGTTSKSKEEVAVGDIAKIDDQTFAVINTDNNGNVVLLSQYNLKEQSLTNDIGYNESTDGIMLMSNNTYIADNDTAWKQYSGTDYYKTIFSEKTYWYVQGENEQLCVASTGANKEELCLDEYGNYISPLDYYSSYYIPSSFGTDSENVPYVYRTKTGEDTENKIYPIINNYKSYLQSLGEDVADVRLMSYAEAKSLGTNQRLANGQVYWLGSIDPEKEYSHGYGYMHVYLIGEDGGLYAWSFYGSKEAGVWYKQERGIRPVVEISRVAFGFEPPVTPETASASTS